MGIELHTDIFYSILFWLFIKKENENLLWLTSDCTAEGQLAWWFLTLDNIRIV